MAVKCTWKIACGTKTSEEVDEWLRQRRINIALNDMNYEPEVYDSGEMIKKRLRTNSYLLDSSILNFVENKVQK